MTADMANVNDKSPMFSDSTYNKLKFVALIALPAMGVLYFALSQIWGLPKGVEVVGTITVVDTFLGALLQISTKQYNNSDAKYDGELNVGNDAPGVKMPETTMEELHGKKEVTLKVVGPNQI